MNLLTSIPLQESRRVDLFDSVNGYDRKGFAAQLESIIVNLCTLSHVMESASGSPPSIDITFGGRVRVTERLSAVNLNFQATGTMLVIRAGVTIKAFDRRNWDQENGENAFLELISSLVADSWMKTVSKISGTCLPKTIVIR